MAKIKNIAGETRNIPLAGGEVETGDTFEVDDDTFHQHSWSDKLFEIVEQPKSKPPADPDAPPAKNAKRDDWVEYALSRGADPTVVEDLDRDQLIEQYGQEN
jgi:hypothetical protein